jgi:hypothetical protein
VLFYVLFDCVVLCIVMYVNVYYCHRVSTQLQLNISYHIKKRPRPTSVRTAANIEAVRVALTRSPSKSTRRASVELGISRRSLQRILHSDLHLFPHKTTVLHKLTAIDNQWYDISCATLCLKLCTFTYLNVHSFK